MWKRRKILIVLDGSEESEATLDAACSVAEGPDTQILLVSVVPAFRFIPSPDVPVLLTDLAEEAGRAQRYLDEVASTLTGRLVRTLVRVSTLSAGEMVAELKHLAAEEQCDLLVMAADAETARAVGPLLGGDLSLLLVPPKPVSRVRGKRIWAPRLRPAPVSRLASAIASLFSA